MASIDTEGAAEPGGSADGVTVGEAEAAGGEARLGADVDGGAEGEGGCVVLGVLVADGGGDPPGAVVHPASTPAHTRALRAVTGRLTTSG